MDEWTIADQICIDIIVWPMLLKKVTTAKVRPQEHADKNEAPSPQVGGFQGQEQEGSRRPFHHAPDIFILFIIAFCSETPIPKEQEQKALLLNTRGSDSALTVTK